VLRDVEECRDGDWLGVGDEGGRGHDASRIAEIVVDVGAAGVASSTSVGTPAGTAFSARFRFADGTGGGDAGFGGRSEMSNAERGGCVTTGGGTCSEGDGMPRDFAVGEPRYERVDAMNAWSSSVTDRVLEERVEGEVDLEVGREKAKRLGVFLSSMSSHPDRSSMVRGRGWGLLRDDERDTISGFGFVFFELLGRN